MLWPVRLGWPYERAVAPRYSCSLIRERLADELFMKRASAKPATIAPPMKAAGRWRAKSSTPPTRSSRLRLSTQFAMLSRPSATWREYSATHALAPLLQVVRCAAQRLRDAFDPADRGIFLVVDRRARALAHILRRIFRLPLQLASELTRFPSGAFGQVFSLSLRRFGATANLGRAGA
jgi:hypothetical protein